MCREGKRLLRLSCWRWTQPAGVAPTTFNDSSNLPLGGCHSPSARHTNSQTTSTTYSRLTRIFVISRSPVQVRMLAHEIKRDSALSGSLFFVCGVTARSHVFLAPASRFATHSGGCSAKFRASDKPSAVHCSFRACGRWQCPACCLRGTWACCLTRGCERDVARGASESNAGQERTPPSRDAPRA